MVNVKVTNWKGNEYTGQWNEKFYNPEIEGIPAGCWRIYIDNERIHISNEEKERLLKQVSSCKIEEDNNRIRIIKEEFEKLDEQAKKLLVSYLQREIFKK